MPITVYPAFASRIQIVGPQSFSRIQNDAPAQRFDEFSRFCTRRPQLLLQGGPQAALTTGVAMCNAGGITSHDSERPGFTAFHLYPRPLHAADPADDKNQPVWSEIMEDNLKQLGQEIKTLRDAGGSGLHGLIAGGQNDFLASKAYLQKIGHAMHRNNIYYSTLWGQPEGQETSVHYDSARDTWSLCPMRSGNPAFAVKTREELAGAYSQIHILPGDTLDILPDKPESAIPKKRLTRVLSLFV